MREEQKPKVESLDQKEEKELTPDEAAQVQGGDSATGGAGAGKIKFNEFTIKKTSD